MNSKNEQKVNCFFCLINKLMINDSKEWKQNCVKPITSFE